MFEFADSPVTVPGPLGTTFAGAWQQIASTGTWWTGAERVAIAAVARRNRLGDPHRDPSLPGAANDAAALLAATPAVTTREWVDGVVSRIGEPRYVELVGIVARVVAVDTVTRLLGCDLEPFLESAAGDPSQEPARGPVRKGRAWIGIDGVASPPNVLSAVPAARRAMVDVSDVLYMSPGQMEDPDITMWGLHRTQIELVASTVSFANECFY